MKHKLIRNGVFETNSSSSHSISLGEADKDFILDALYPNYEGNIVLTGGEFGWQWFKHNDAFTKANYAAVAHQNDPTELIELIKEQTGCKEVILAFSGDYNHPNWSYIDHDSEGVCPSGKEDLKNFIFNKNSWLFGGNDNETPAPNFYDVPTLKSDGTVEVPTYKYKLSISGHGISETALFKEMPDEEQLDSAFYGMLGHDIVLTQDGKFGYTNVWSSNDDFFEYSGWKKKPDIENKLIYFVHRNMQNIIRPILEQEFGRNYEWTDEVRKREREIENELLDNNDPRVVRSHEFRIDAI